jgi:hypothetical protein
MKTISSLFAFIFGTFARSKANIESGSDSRKDRSSSVRIVLIPFRAPNDQLQLFSLPPARFAETGHPTYLDFND